MNETKVTIDVTLDGDTVWVSSTGYGSCNYDIDITFSVAGAIEDFIETYIPALRAK